MNQSATSVTILGREYPLKLSLNAMQEIKKRYGGVDRAAEGLQGDGNIFEKLEYAIILVSILATEGARSHNYEFPTEEAIPDLTEDIAGTALTIADLGTISPKIIRAINEGMGRKVFSEDDEKNTPGA